MLTGTATAPILMAPKKEDTEIAKSVAGAVGALEELLVGYTLVAAFDGDVLRAAFENVAVHEVGGDVEDLR